MNTFRHIAAATAAQALIMGLEARGEFGIYGRPMRPLEKYMRKSRYMPHHGKNVHYDRDLAGQIIRTKLKAA